jgi:hypothetical protein
MDQLILYHHLPCMMQYTFIHDHHTSYPAASCAILRCPLETLEADRISLDEDIWYSNPVPSGGRSSKLETKRTYQIDYPPFYDTFWHDKMRSTRTTTKGSSHEPLYLIKFLGHPGN